jgi:subtilisin-like proprotein convertase family protein
VYSAFSSKQSIILTIDTDACKDTDSQVNYLEHVQAFITVKASRRGDVTLYLVSPMNTTYVQCNDAVCNTVILNKLLQTLQN